MEKNNVAFILNMERFLVRQHNIGMEHSRDAHGEFFQTPGSAIKALEHINFSYMSVAGAWVHVSVLLCMLAPAAGHAAHPLITEDASTQGNGKLQLELTHEHDKLRQNGANAYATLSSAVLSYGVVDSLDAIIALPYLRLDHSSNTPTASGMGDVGVDIKWRFYEKGPLSLAFKPGITFPSGDETQGLGAGKHGWGIFFTGSYEAAPWALHLHLGSFQNHNVVNERVHLWHGSAAITRRMGEEVRLILDAGINSHTDRGTRSDPAFLIAGLIWSLYKNFDIDAGYKIESSDSARTHTLLSGLTWRW